ncbi:MAG: ABC-three component system protein [Negativicutes bacterium]
MKSNAPGQLLGYSMQFPRALYHLLRSAPQDVVCVEVLGDVATLGPDGKLLSEEDKSSIVGNPMTDRSSDLWKTFSNWIVAINDGDIDVEKTNFVLYCNHSGRLSIVNKFSAAQNEADIQSAVNYAKNELKDITSEHEIWNYYDTVVNKNEKLLIKVIQKFELEIGTGAGYDDVKIEIKRKHVPPGQIDFIMDKLSGWILRVLSEKIADRERAIISWEEFDHQFKVLYDRSRCRELVDFTLQYPIKDERVRSQVKIRPIYLQQLEAIKLKDEEIIAEVSDYLRADVNREKWIAAELIDDDIASDFEDRLTRFWENQRKRIQITEKTRGEIDQGQLLLIECKSRQEKIRDMVPPSSTIAGTYHALADDLVIGWHSKWEALFPKKGEG